MSTCTHLRDSTPHGLMATEVGCCNILMRVVEKVRTAARGAIRTTAGRAMARKEQAIEAIASGWACRIEDGRRGLVQDRGKQV